MNNSILTGGLVVLVLWAFGLWKAAELWSPRFLIAESDANRRIDESGSILPKLFWICNGFILIAALLQITAPKEIFRPVWITAFILGEMGLLVLLIRVEVTAKAQPVLIRLIAQHRLKTMTGYEHVLYWTRTFWIFEKPVQIFCAAMLFAISGLLTFFYDEFSFAAFGGFNLLFSLWGMCRYSTLVVKRDGVGIHRWLGARPTIPIPNTDIVSVRIDQPISHRIFGVWRLTLVTSGGAHLRVALKDPAKAKKYMDEILPDSVPTQEAKER